MINQYGDGSCDTCSGPWEDRLTIPLKSRSLGRKKLRVCGSCTLLLKKLIQEWELVKHATKNLKRRLTWHETMRQRRGQGRVAGPTRGSVLKKPVAPEAC